jgi:hypothetical protein
VKAPTVLGDVPVGAYCRVTYRGEPFELQVTGRFEKIIWCRWRGDGGWTGPLPMDPGLPLIGAVLT